MLRIFNQARRLRSDVHWLTHFARKAILGFTLLFTLVASVASEWAYNDYWGVNGWKASPTVPTVELQIAPATDEKVHISWTIAELANPNHHGAFLQTSTNLCSEGLWSVVTNEPVINTNTGLHTVGLPVAGSQRFFRLITPEVSLFPVFGFAIFFNGQLEFTQCPPLTIRGRTHANGPVCLGAPAVSPNTLKFMEAVTTASSILYSNLGGYTSFSAPVYSGTPPFITGVPALELPIGTNNTAAAMREIINLPPAGESASSLIGQQRFYNKANIALLVSNTSVTMIVKNYGGLTGLSTNIAYNSVAPTATQRTNLAQALPFLNLTNVFRDYREADWVMPTQIDIGVLKNWLPTNSFILSRYPAGTGSYPNILYVGDFRTITNLHAIRLMNGSIIPTNGFSAAQATGFTIATPNPIYVWGHYNTPNPAHRGTTNTTATFPAALIGDAITVLSPNWTDNASSSLTHSSRDAQNTTVNAAIIAGSVYSTGSAAGQWSGGVHNLTRLIQDWGGRTLTLNTSLVNLYNSVQANTQFLNPGNYYYAPTRNFNFDQNFLIASKLPPGTPTVVGITPVH